MAGKRNLILALVLLFVGLGAILLFIYRDKIFGKGSGNLASNAPPGPGNTGTPESSFPLKFGSNNKYVGNLQRYLLSKSPNCLPKYGADDDWGSETEACVNSVLGINVIDYNKYKSLGLA